MMGYRRPEKLKDMLVRADVRLNKTKTPIVQNNFLTLNESVTIPREENLVQTSITSFLSGNSENNQTPVVDPKYAIFGKKICTNIKCKSCPYIEKSGSITAYRKSLWQKTM